MPDFAWIAEGLITFIYIFSPLLVAALLGITALAIAWGGRRAGVVFGVLTVLVSLIGLAALWSAAPHLWWIAVIPLAIGATAAQAWYRHTGPATARPFQFNLRGLFVLILLVCVILGGIASGYRQQKIEEAAAMILEGLPETRSKQIRWSFGRVQEIIFFSLADPADMDRAGDAIEQLSQLRVLQLDSSVPPRFFDHVGHLTELRSFFAQNIPITDDDLRHLANLKNLEVLDLEGSALTDAGLDHLRGLKRLHLLHIYHADQISPQAMRDLRSSLPRLDNP